MDLPIDRAASGSRLAPNSSTTTSTKMIKCHGCNPFSMVASYLRLEAMLLVFGLAAALSQCHLYCGRAGTKQPGPVSGVRPDHARCPGESAQGSLHSRKEQHE